MGYMKILLLLLIAIVSTKGISIEPVTDYIQQPYIQKNFTPPAQQYATLLNPLIGYQGNQHFQSPEQGTTQILPIVQETLLPTNQYSGNPTLGQQTLYLPLHHYQHPPANVNPPRPRVIKHQSETSPEVPQSQQQVVKSVPLFQHHVYHPFHTMVLHNQQTQNYKLPPTPPKIYRNFLPIVSKPVTPVQQIPVTQAPVKPVMSTKPIPAQESSTEEAPEEQKEEVNEQQEEDDDEKVEDDDHANVEKESEEEAEAEAEVEAEEDDEYYRPRKYYREKYRHRDEDEEDDERGRYSNREDDEEDEHSSESRQEHSKYTSKHKYPKRQAKNKPCHTEYSFDDFTAPFRTEPYFKNLKFFDEPKVEFKMFKYSKSTKKPQVKEYLQGRESKYIPTVHRNHESYKKQWIISSTTSSSK